MRDNRNLLLMKTLHRICMALGLAAGLGSTLPAVAQPYPAKPIRIIVPFAPGGPADLLARTLGQKLQESWGQPVLADNKPGAGGNLGMDLGAKAAPDGYTLLLAPTGNLTVNPHLGPLPYDVMRDLAPVTQLASVENVLVVNPGIAANNVQELVALARGKPGSLSFASPGAGSQAHVAGEFLKGMTGTDLIHIAYKGTGPALNDLLGGQVSMMFSQMSSALPHIRAGKLRALGVASLKRSALLPALPTVAEQNLAGFEAVSWYALMAPAGTPADVIAKLQVESARILRLADVREKLAGLGAEAVGNRPEELAAIMRAESARWQKVVKDANIKAE